jgi:hypothetical protein
MKRMLLLLFIGIIGVSRASADCPALSLSSNNVLLNYPAPFTDQLRVSWSYVTDGSTYDVLVTRFSTGETFIKAGIADRNIQIYYSELYNGKYTFQVRRNCPDGTTSNWSNAIERTIESIDCKFDSPSACPGIEFLSPGNIAIDSVSGLKELVINCNNYEGCIKTAITANGGSITGYKVESIPYSPPYPTSAGTPIFVNLDDVYSDVVNLPFGFCFYENNYRSAIMAANGFISFNTQYANGASGYVLTGLSDIPNPSMRTDWKNAIYGVMEDIDPSKVASQNSGGSIRWALLGQIPCRTLCVSYHNIPLFGDNTHWNSYQMVLYEGTNIIDVYVAKRFLDIFDGSVWNGNIGVIGVQNSAGTLATAAPGRNLTSPSWTTYNGTNHDPEAWRFIPLTTSTHTVTWYKGAGFNGEIIGRSECLPLQSGMLEGQTVTVRLQFTSCSGDNLSFADTAIIRWETLKQIDDVVCNSKPYTKHGFNITPAQTAVEGEHFFSRNFPAGQNCDSTYVLNLTVSPKITYQYSETICEGTTYDFNDRTLTQAGTYTDIKQTQAGCDSIITLNLFTTPKLKIKLNPISEICADDRGFSIPFNIEQGNPTSYRLQFDNNALAQGFVNDRVQLYSENEVAIDLPNSNVRPDKYSVNLTFEDGSTNCGEDLLSAEFTVKYKESILEQNWEDVIALLNKTYNGGYEFSSYQWYKNGQKIENETRSYIYLPGGLDMSAEYCLELTRTGENYSVFTCYMHPANKADIDEAQLIVTNSGRSSVIVKAATSGVVKVWSIYGYLVDTKYIIDNFCEISFPSSGMYILEINLDNGTRKVLKVEN